MRNMVCLMHQTVLNTFELLTVDQGPIVRISPWEVHIADPEFLSVILDNKSQFDKKIEWKYRFGIPHSTFDTIEHQQWAHSSFYTWPV